MVHRLQIPLFDLIRCLSYVVDLTNPILANHHMMVAYIALRIAKEMNLSVEQQGDLVLAGMLHDIGSFSINDRLELLQFETKFEPEDLLHHAKLGYRLLNQLNYLANASLFIRFHHVFWNEGRGEEIGGKQVPLESHILHLADRVAVLIDPGKEILDLSSNINEQIKTHSGQMFVPQLVDAFLSVSTKEYFWLDTVSPNLEKSLARNVILPIIELDIEGIRVLAKFFARIIDFRSRFTATHSARVAASAAALAKLVGFSTTECQMMTVAGYLHDLGKIAIPTEILEKPGELTKSEFNIIRRHAFYTYRSLEHISAIDTINAWASFHHERIDGKGYPFHIKGEDISLGSKIIAGADVFSALTEDRPYRKAMTKDMAIQVMQNMCDDCALDPHIVSLLKHNLDEINYSCMLAQSNSSSEYDAFLSDTLTL